MASAPLFHLNIGYIALTAIWIKGYNQLMIRNALKKAMFYVFERWSFNGTV